MPVFRADLLSFSTIDIGTEFFVCVCVCVCVCVVMGEGEAGRPSVLCIVG